MKIKNKLILIVLFLFFFIFFKNSDCFALQYYEPTDFVKNYVEENYLNSTYDSYFILSSETYNGSFIIENDVTLYNSKNSKFTIAQFYNSNSLKVGCALVNDLSQTVTYATLGIYTSKSTGNLNTVSNYSDHTVDSSSNGRFSMQFYNSRYCFQFGLTLDKLEPNLFACNRNVYQTNEILSSWSDKLYFDDDTFLTLYSNVEPVNFDLFKLNLYDKNFNNNKHTFNLYFSNNDAIYSDFMNLYDNNYNYCIYITNYHRDLVYKDKKIETPISYGAYNLSGYIDFLVSDKAFFYYSPHYNKIKATSGNYTSGALTNDYRRFRFSLVFSEDSDNVHFDISEENGFLFENRYNLSKNAYFIGSNQTILYAKEDNNYILDSLTDSVFYEGCSNSCFYNYYSNSYIIKNRGEDNHIFNFNFSGGSVNTMFLTDDNFSENLSSVNNTNKENIENKIIIEDSTNGNSFIIPYDNTTITYPENTLTNNSSDEDSEKYYNENIDKPHSAYDKDEEDTSNWSIWDFVKGIFSTIGKVLSTLANLISNLIDGLIELFVPSSDFFNNSFSDLNDWFSDKLGFIFYPFEFILNFFNRLLNIEFTEPIINIPEISEPITNETVISDFTFNFNDLLINEKIKYAHDLYLMFVDVILTISFINLLKNKFEEVMTKWL